MATRITITTNEGSSNYTLSTGARGPAGAAGATGPSPAALEFAGSDPNISCKSEMTISGPNIPVGVATVLTQIDDPVWGKAWTSNGDTIGNNQGAVAFTSIQYVGSSWFILGWDAGGAQIYSDSDSSSEPSTGWPDNGTFNINLTTVTATGEPTATHLAQWCRASTAWWQWNGDDWQPIRTIAGEPITLGDDGLFYRQFVRNPSGQPAQAFEEITF